MDAVTYMIQFNSKYDEYFNNAYQANGEGSCGTAGRRSGLQVKFYESATAVDYIQRIPYNKQIEYPMFITNGGLCDVFSNIEIEIVAACEYPSPGHYVYQYGVVDDGKGNKKISYDPAHRIYASNSTKSFSVSWSPVSSSSAALIGGSDQTTFDVLMKLSNSMDSLNKANQELSRDNQELNKSIEEIKTSFLVAIGVVFLVVMAVTIYVYYGFNRNSNSSTSSFNNDATKSKFDDSSDHEHNLTLQNTRLTLRNQTTGNVFPRKFRSGITATTGLNYRDIYAVGDENNDFSIINPGPEPAGEQFVGTEMTAAPTLI